MQIKVQTPPDFDFIECVKSHGWRQLAPFSWDDESLTLTRVEQFDSDAPVIVKVNAHDGLLDVAVQGEVTETDAISRVKRMLQLDLPVDQFHAFCKNHPTLNHVPIRKQGRLLRSPTLFEDYLKAVATTNTTWAQTKAMVARIVNGFGTSTDEDSGLKSFPTASQIAAVSLDDFSATARMGYRNVSVHKVACQIASGNLDLENWQDATIPTPDLYKRLLFLPGIGPYAASCLMLYLGRYDRVNVDSWARTMVSRELGIKATDKDVHAFFEEYGEWRALAYHFYPWREDPPAY